MWLPLFFRAPLIFKQTIALGWDCPRAGVLLIYRELKSEAFTVQTVGRILRMPEQRHYPDDLLNLGYVYTNLSRDTLRIDADAAGYLSTLRADRVADYAPLTLPSQHVTNQRGERNRLGDSFRATFNRAGGLGAGAVAAAHSRQPLPRNRRRRPHSP